MSNRYNFTGSLELTNSTGIKCTINNKSQTNSGVFELPNKSSGSYVLATTGDLSSNAYFSRGIFGVPNVTATVATIPTPMAISATNNNVTPVNFLMGANTLITYIGTEAIVAKVTGNVSLMITGPVNELGLLIFKNSGGGPETVGAISASAGGTYNLFADTMVTLEPNDTLELFYYTDTNEFIETRTLNFNAHRI